MSFRISGLALSQFRHLFDMSDEELEARGIRRRTADAKPGFPCRVTLEDAEAGETLLLLNYEHQPADTPFRASHAIYVREKAAETFDAVGEIPEVMRTRILSLRAFDAEGMLLAADLADGASDGELEGTIERMLADPAVAYLHAHYAKPGCYAARIERA